jgi:hypothetical protein
VTAVKKSGGFIDQWWVSERFPRVSIRSWRLGTSSAMPRQVLRLRNSSAELAADDFPAAIVFRNRLRDTPVEARRASEEFQRTTVQSFVTSFASVFMKRIIKDGG